MVHTDPTPEFQASPGIVDPTLQHTVADTMHLLAEPSVQALLAMDYDDGHFGQIRIGLQQTALSYMFTQGVIGTQQDLRNRDVMDNFGSSRNLNLTLRGINEFQNGLYAYSSAQGKTVAEGVNDIVTGNTMDNIVLASRDLITLYRQGLITKDGDSANLQRASQVLRFLGVNLLFTDAIRDPGFAAVFVDDLYTHMVGSRPTEGKHNLLATKYAAEYIKPVTHWRSVQSIRKRLGTDPQNVTDRAALQLILGNFKGELMQTDIDATRSQYQTALTATAEIDDIRTFNDRIVELVRSLESSSQTAEAAVELSEDVIQATQLNWEVLPPGELERAAREIVAQNQSESKPAEIDLERLRILDNLRTAWGSEACYYARGTLGKRRTVKQQGKEEPDQYLMLVMQDLAPDGTVRQEHVVAESPIANRNALYVFRQDVSEGLSWREVMALPKHYARSFGARPLTHITPREAPDGYLVPAMTEKVKILLSCNPDEFARIKFDGERGFRIAKAVVANAVETAED